MVELKNTPECKIYEIKLKGLLNESCTDWFEGLTITHEKDGTTKLAGEIVDQAALHGVLKKVRDLGLPLLSVNGAESDVQDKTKSNSEGDKR